MGCILSIILLFVFLRFGNFLMEILGDSLGCIVRCSCMMAFSIYSEKKFREKINQKLLEEEHKESEEKYKKLLDEKSIYECPNCGEKFEDSNYTLGVKCPKCNKIFIARDGSIYFEEEINKEILENYIYARSGGIGWFGTYSHEYDEKGENIFLELYPTINKRSVKEFREKVFESELLKEIFECGFKTAGKYSNNEKDFLCISNTMKLFEKSEHKEIIKTMICSIMLMVAYNVELHVDSEEAITSKLLIIKFFIQECIFGTKNFSKMEKIFRETIDFDDEDFLLMTLSAMFLAESNKERENQFTDENEKNSSINNFDIGENSKYYRILNLNNDASMEEVKKSYRKLVKMYHPDKYASKNMTEKEIKKLELKFIEIQEAYEKIKDLRNE